MLLHRSSAHGYTLLEQLAEFGFEDLNPGVVYRALREMEADGLVESSWDKEQSQGPPRRIYRITAQGDEVLAWWTVDLQETRSLIDDLLVAYRRHMQEGRGDYH